jgi:hypothetical protein
VARTIGLLHSVSERFARFLLETAADGEVSNGTVRVRLAMTHEEIRKLVGTSRETITRLLSEFRRNEAAEWKGSTLIIRNQPALKNMVRAETALWGQAIRIMQSWWRRRALASFARLGRARAPVPTRAGQAGGTFSRAAGVSWILLGIVGCTAFGSKAGAVLDFDSSPRLQQAATSDACKSWMCRSSVR